MCILTYYFSSSKIRYHMHIKPNTFRYEVWTCTFAGCSPWMRLPWQLRPRFHPVDRCARRRWRCTMIPKLATARTGLARSDDFFSRSGWWKILQWILPSCKRCPPSWRGSGNGARGRGERAQSWWRRCSRWREMLQSARHSCIAWLWCVHINLCSIEKKCT